MNEHLNYKVMLMNETFLSNVMAENITSDLQRIIKGFTKIYGEPTIIKIVKI